MCVESNVRLHYVAPVERRTLTHARKRERDGTRGINLGTLLATVEVGIFMTGAAIITRRK